MKISCNFLNTVLKVKNRMIIWVQNCCKYIDCLPSRSVFPGGSAGKKSSCNAADLGSIPGLGKSPGEGKGCPLQYSDLEKFHGLYCPWGHKDSDTIERLSLSLLASRLHGCQGAVASPESIRLHFTSPGKVQFN